MKWLSRIFRSGGNRGGGGGGGGSGGSGGSGGRHPQQLLGDQENMVWRAPARSSVNFCFFSPLSLVRSSLVSLSLRYSTFVMKFDMLADKVYDVTGYVS